MSAITLFLSLFPTVREVYGFILAFYHFLNRLSDDLYVPASASPDSCPSPGHGCDLLMERALVGAVSVLFLECKTCLDYVLNWPRIRLLPADLRLLRAILVSGTWDVRRCCQNIFFLFLTNTLLFKVINPKWNLKVKYTFKNALFSL